MTTPPLSADDEMVLATVKSAAADIARGFAYFEAKSATMKLKLLPAHTLAAHALKMGEAAVGATPGAITPYDGTTKS